MTEKQRMTYNVPGDEYGENSKSSGRQRDLPCDAAGITGKGYSKTTRNAYGEPSQWHLDKKNPKKIQIIMQKALDKYAILCGLVRCC